MAWRRGLRPPACLASQKDGCWRPGAVKEHKAKACAKRLAAEAMVDRSSPTAATTGPAAGRLSKLHLHICCSPLGSVAVAATGPDTGLHGLSEHERYFFETKGYLVVPDMLTPAQVDRMNEAIDQSPQQAEGLETFTTKRAICYREHDVVRARGRARPSTFIGSSTRLLAWMRPSQHTPHG